MPPGLSWSSEQTEPLAVLAVVTCCYVVFHFVGAAERWRPRLQPGRSQEAAQAASVIAQRLTGMLALGVVPAVLAMVWLPGGLLAHGLALPSPAVAAGFVLAVVVLVVPVVALSARRSATWDHYPEIRARRWSRGLRLANALSWLAYLLAYELFFRGVFLFAMARWVGPWPAIGIVTAVYVAVHLHKPAPECLGSLVMGVIFGAVALAGAGIWGPVLGHLLIAVSNDELVLRADSSIELVSDSGSEASSG